VNTGQTKPGKYAAENDETSNPAARSTSIDYRKKRISAAIVAQLENLDMNADRARWQGEGRYGGLGGASDPTFPFGWRRTLSISTAMAAFFALSWIAGCSNSDSASPSGSGGSAASDVDGSTDCTKRTDLDTYSANMVKSGSTGVYKFQLISSDPAPPGQAKHVWMLKVLKASDGSTAAQLPIVGDTSMPDHMHPIPYQPILSFDPATGVYTVTNVNFTLMPGRWKVRFSIPETAGSDVIIDSAGFDFCIS
jgi:hypothetical protein